MKRCPELKSPCPCREYAKDALCDWPYHIDMDPGQIVYMTELLDVIGEEERIERQDFKTHHIT